MGAKGNPNRTSVPPALILGAVLWATLALACAPDAGTSPRPQPAPPAAQSPHPQRIVTLSPNLTELVFALGAGDRVVGVSQYCNYPPEARTKPRVGALVQMDYEKLRSLEPDLVVLLPGHHEVAARLARLGIGSITIKSESIETIQAGLRAVGRRLGIEDRAEEVIADQNAQMLALRERILARRGDQPRPRVLFVVGRNPGSLQQIYACGSGNYLDELLGLVGADNVLGKTDIPWPVVNKERILELDPDVILDSSALDHVDATAKDASGENARLKSHMAAWSQLPGLRAAREGKITPMVEGRLMVPGPGFVEYAAAIETAIFGSTDAAPQRAPHSPRDASKIDSAPDLALKEPN